MKELKRTKLCDQCSYSEKSYLECNAGDYGFGIYRYEKDRTFNEFRRDVYFELYKECMCDKTLLESYTETKNELKDKNGILHEFIYKNKNIKLIDLLLFNDAHFI